ncbi:MAG: hypothetical protein LBM99_01030, partial [Bacillales bacterium]|nr:hypothetical protein [Bacillales bacterium]
KDTNLSQKTSYTESLFIHLEKITNYLLSNIDPNTHCLKINYGDWNDALDGLGEINGDRSHWGNGVSVMASLQLYECLEQLIDLYNYLDKDTSFLKEKRTLLEKGLLKNSIVTLKNEKKIVHGWGHNQSYYVGSFQDSDNISRDSLTSNAFFVISNMINKKPSLKNDILLALKRLDSKYGFKTFSVGFQADVKGVGRIVNLPIGTAENGAVYVHASLFATLALYKLGKGKEAFFQLKKLLPIYHKKITTSPFIMSNSYSYNQELGLDGDSMNDWYTGSSNTLIKTIVRGLWGVKNTLKLLIIKPSNYFFSNKAELKLLINQTIVTLSYSNTKNNKRIFLINNNQCNEVFFNKISKELYIEIDKSKLTDTLNIQIID